MLNFPNVFRRAHVLEATAKELSAATGNRVISWSADIRDPQAVKSAVDHIEKEIGLPNVIVNNAAGNFISPAERLTSNGWKTIVDIVLNGTANVTLDIGKRLIAAQQGLTDHCGFLLIYAHTLSGFLVLLECPIISSICLRLGLAINFV